MRKEKYHVHLDETERSLLLHSLVEFKNGLMRQGRYTDCIDEIITKVSSARKQKLRTA